MTCTSKQALLIDKLQERGATIPCKEGGSDAPDFSMLDSVAQADVYIKKWGHLMDRGGHYVSCTAADWGGIPNC